MKFTVYTKTVCVQCTGVKAYLKSKGLVEGDAYDTVNLEENDAALQRVKEAGHLAAPVVEWEGGMFAGFKPGDLDEVAAAWHAHQASLEVNDTADDRELVGAAA